MLHGGFTRKKALLFNFLTALTAVIGAIFTLLLSSQIQGIVLFLVPFAAGEFIYIAGSDLIPELHKEVSLRNSLQQLAMFILGIGVMLVLAFLPLS